MGRFDILDTLLSGVKVIQRKPIGDSRGSFERLFCETELRPALNGNSIVQINRSRTTKAGTVRGMHFQYPPHAETKFISCLRGEVFDVAIDVRRGSKTFLKWQGEKLSEENHRTLFVSEGFAHGFQTLTDDCELIYFHTASYVPSAEHALNALDPLLAIPWPLEVTAMSEGDRAHPMLTTDFRGIQL